jgi:hypothetical protein
LSTVIVGLATVAGIQAFSENQAQASQDALVQKGTSIASDVQGLAGKPTQMGGIDLNNSDYSGSDIANQLGYDHSSGTVDAPGAGNAGECTIIGDSGSASDGTVDIECTSENSPQTVTVTFTQGADEPVSTSFSSS